MFRAWPGISSLNDRSASRVDRSYSVVDSLSPGKRYVRSVSVCVIQGGETGAPTRMMIEVMV